MSKNIDWDEAFKKYAELGLSDAAFCRQENIPTTSFYKQKKARGIVRAYKRRKPAREIPTEETELVELNLGSEKTLTVANDRTPTIRLSNRQGVTIEVYL